MRKSMTTESHPNSPPAQENDGAAPPGTIEASHRAIKTMNRINSIMEVVPRQKILVIELEIPRNFEREDQIDIVLAVEDAVLQRKSKLWNWYARMQKGRPT